MTDILPDLPNFDRAEYTAKQGSTGDRCERCQQTFTDRFFQLNGEQVCEPCANLAVSMPAEGAGPAFAKAFAVGIAAAALGSILYAGVEIATGWTIGYVALAVGWMVGKGMKWASEGRGGRPYQIAASVLTYLSVSFASVIVIVYGIIKRNPKQHIVLGERFLRFVAKYALLSPVLELQNGLGGILGLVILFIGIRAAWTLTAGSAYRITGPHSAPDGVVV